MVTTADVGRERLLALDVFRGITVAGMLLVNNPGSWGAIYPPLAHAAWHGWTPTDLVFPFFLFIVGITTQLSLNARRERGATERELQRQVIRRGALIFACGLFLSWFPGWTYGPIAELPDASFVDRIWHRVAHLRVMGVLQRIGLAYLLAGLLSLRTNTRQKVWAVAGLLLGYWALLTLVPVPGTGTRGFALLNEPSLVLSAWFDRRVLGEAHLYSGTRTWDPEGLLSTLPAVATVLLGNLAGRLLGGDTRPLGDRLTALFGMGALGMMIGLCWHWVFPINKGLWTSSYVVFTGGMAAVTLATCIWLIDMQRIQAWSRPFVPFGVNPLLAFVGSGIMARLMGGMIAWTQDGDRVTLQRFLYRSVYEPVFSAPRNASLAYALSFVLIWFVFLWLAQRKRVFLKL